jgi:hypothetical protein
MARFFSRKPRTSPRTDIVLGLIFIAQGVFGVLNRYSSKNDSSDIFIFAWCFIGICGAWSFVRGLLRMRNEVPETEPSDASENPSENILHDPEFPPNKTIDDE